MSVCATTISSTRCIAMLPWRQPLFQQDPVAHPVPDIANVNTLAGRVVLVCVKDCMQQEATTRMQRLIEANQEVRQTFGKHLTAEAGVTDKA